MIGVNSEKYHRIISQEVSKTQAVTSREIFEQVRGSQAACAGFIPSYGVVPARVEGQGLPPTSKKIQAYFVPGRRPGRVYFGGVSSHELNTFTVQLCRRSLVSSVRRRMAARYAAVTPTLDGRHYAVPQSIPTIQEFPRAQRK